MGSEENVFLTQSQEAECLTEGWSDSKQLRPGAEVGDQASRVQPGGPGHPESAWGLAPGAGTVGVLPGLQKPVQDSLTVLFLFFFSSTISLFFCE